MQQSKQQRARGRETGRRRKKVIEQKQQQQQQKMEINYLVSVITTRGNRKQSLQPFILSLSLSFPHLHCAAVAMSTTGWWIVLLAVAAESEITENALKCPNGTFLGIQSMVNQSLGRTAISQVQTKWT